MSFRKTYAQALAAHKPLSRKTPMRRTGIKSQPVSLSEGEKSGKVGKICSICGQQFSVYPYRALSATVCSPQCNGKRLRRKVSRDCLNCGMAFQINPSQFTAYKGAGKYCSRQCAYAGMVETTKTKPIRDRYGRSNRKADKEWQLSVRLKDDYTCQRCGVQEPYIHTHHVAPRGRRPDLRHDVSNGKCLCNACHSWVHEHPLEATKAGLFSGETYELARKKSKGEHHGCAKLTNDDVISLRQRFLNGERVNDLAAEHGIHRSHLSGILHGKSWAHLLEVMPPEKMKQIVDETIDRREVQP